MEDVQGRQGDGGRWSQGRKAARPPQEEWTAELFVPWSSLGFERVPASGTRLGLNYARHRNPVAEDYQWNRTFGSNHRPGWFGVAELE